MSIKLIDITPLIHETYYGSLLMPNSNLETGEALSPVTIKHHQILSKAFADAARVGLNPSNPTAAANTPRSKKYKGKFLNGEQLEEMLKLFKGSPVELPVKLCSIYGFRRSEVLGLKWDNVDLFNSCGRSVKFCATYLLSLKTKQIDFCTCFSRQRPIYLPLFQILFESGIVQRQ